MGIVYPHLRTKKIQTLLFLVTITGSKAAAGASGNDDDDDDNSNSDHSSFHATNVAVLVVCVLVVTIAGTLATFWFIKGRQSDQKLLARRLEGYSAMQTPTLTKTTFVTDPATRPPATLPPPSSILEIMDESDDWYSRSSATLL